MIRRYIPASWLIPICVAVVFLLLAQNVFAEIPQTLSFQGRVKKDSVFLEGEKSLTFRLWNDKTDTSPEALLWEEVQLVNFSNGQFAVELGAVNPIDLAFDKKYYLGITVNDPGETEMTPRKKLNSSAYAIRAKDADHADDSFAADQADDSFFSDLADLAEDALEADHAVDANHALTADEAFEAQVALSCAEAHEADWVLGFNPVRMAIVTPGLRSGNVPAAGSAIYTDPLSALEHLSDWCDVPAGDPDSRCLLQIMPGIYTIEDLTVPSGVHIVGAGRDATTIQLGVGPLELATDTSLEGLAVEGSSTDTFPTVWAHGNVRIRGVEIRGDLTAETNGYLDIMDTVVRGRLQLGGPPSVESAVSLTHVEITGADDGVVVGGSSAPVTLNDVSIEALAHGIVNHAVLSLNNVTIIVASDSALGIVNYSTASVTVRNSQITVNSTAFAGYGLDNHGQADLTDTEISVTGTAAVLEGIRNMVGTVSIDHSVIHGSTASLRVAPNSLTRVAMTKLRTQVQGPPQFLDCLNVYTDDGGALKMLDEHCELP